MNDTSVTRNNGSGQVIQCGLSTAFLNKENRSGNARAFGNSFNPSGIPDDQFEKHVLSGLAWTPGNFSGKSRSNDTFISSELIALDFDQNVSIADLLCNPVVQQYPPLLIHSTPSSSPDCYKTRAIWRLSEPVEGTERYRAIARAWAEYVGLDVDPASWKPAQPMFGSTNRVEQPVTNLDELLPVEFVGALTCDHATDDYLRETTRQAHITIDPTSPRAEKYAAATVQGAISDYTGLPAGAKVRHDAFIKLAARLIGMKLGGWPCLENMDALITDAGRATDRTEREITDAISWAYKTVDAIPLTLPDDETTDPPAPKHDDWFTALPDSWRRALLNFFKPSTAPLMELITRTIAMGQINPDGFTAPDLQAVNETMGFDIPQTTLYRGLEELSAVFFPKVDTIDTPQGIIVSNFGKNSLTGRKRTVYRRADYASARTAILEYANPRIYERAHESDDSSILARPTAGMVQAAGVGEGEAVIVAAELDAALAPAYRAQSNREQAAIKRAKRRRANLEQELDDWHSTPLPEGWPLGSAANYRAAFLHAVVKADPDKPRSRRQIADITGVEHSAVKAVRTRAGLKAHQQAPVYAPIKAASELSNQVRQYGRTHNARALKVVSRRADGSATEWMYQKDTAPQLVAEQIAAGAEVFVEFSLPNTHEVVREAPPAVERKPREYVEGLQSRPAEHTTEPKPERYYGPGYDPRWIMQQLKLALKLLGWQRVGGRMVNPDTGEIAPDTPRQIIEIIIGRELSASDQDESWEGFSDLAAELGGVPTLEERAA